MADGSEPRWRILEAGWELGWSISELTVFDGCWALSGSSRPEVSSQPRSTPPTVMLVSSNKTQEASCLSAPVGVSRCVSGAVMDAGIMHFTASAEPKQATTGGTKRTGRGRRLSKGRTRPGRRRETIWALLWCPSFRDVVLDSWTLTHTQFSPALMCLRHPFNDDRSLSAPLCWVLERSWGDVCSTKVNTLLLSQENILNGHFSGSK